MTHTVTNTPLDYPLLNQDKFSVENNQSKYSQIVATQGSSIFISHWINIVHILTGNCHNYVIVQYETVANLFFSLYDMSKGL